MNIYFVLSFFSYFLIIGFFYSWHPLFMSVVIALQSVLISAVIFSFNSINWFSYLLFMVFLSGMMVILIYVSSLASNLVMKYFFFEFETFVLYFILFIAISYYYNLMGFIYDNNLSFSNLPNLIILSGKVYSSDTCLFTILLICYLLLLLILVVKSSMFTKGPLRSF
uniref:NADH dehydrogenase subunit 6 n=1 Tax=Longipodacrangonyx sp. 1 MDMBR-2012 TaxID=1200665 RepID=K7ZVR0_9CRUS|nr:NADH dehydrogenase subunit 6 [Longipodacrangonyx sp. 1 MDMBR-2012]